MRILVDYRPALRQRTGVGEYIHELVRAYTAAGRVERPDGPREEPGQNPLEKRRERAREQPREQQRDEVAVFTASWKDRPAPGLSAELGAQVVDRRVPVHLLNYLWHRVGWPPVEALAGPVDVVHAAHPLLIPARRAAQVVTIHDLFFLSHPENSAAEIRRDYPSLAAAHAGRAHAIVTSTEHGKRLIVEQLGVPGERVYVCPPGAPQWRSLGRSPNLPADGYVLFVGTLEPRKNIGALLDAWELLVAGRRTPATLVLAGRSTAGAAGWLARLATPSLAGRVRHLGYVPAEERENLYAGACALVLPSLDEGFGLPALEAMSAGVPVVASNRGALPEVLGDAGALVEPTDIQGLARVLERVVTDRAWALERAAAGLARAETFTWARAAATLRTAYLDAVDRRLSAGRSPKPRNSGHGSPKPGEGGSAFPKPGEGGG